MADEGEEGEPTELELKTASIAEEFNKLRKPLQLQKEIWRQEIAKMDEVRSEQVAALKVTRDTAVDNAGVVDGSMDLFMHAAKHKARYETCLANLENLDHELHTLALAQGREVEKARLALEPEEE
eukprot:CAMPEP_0185186514 /NCGR_PEP_ID=MMETSP1140-20130426/4109_1 /TAXON_ID=298111 /ORGANISM="Pavlova sp., Strain CCMP459" /LENGTH=124 /DNA_ID=CAMNT_0027752817 /DNA_START=23 /DNA_END=397 /DNA_ORIENTATION=-